MDCISGEEFGHETLLPETIEEDGSTEGGGCRCEEDGLHSLEGSSQPPTIQGEHKRLAARKRRTLSWKAKQQDSDPSDIRQLAEDLMGDVTVLERYPVDFNEEFEGRLT